MLHRTDDPAKGVVYLTESMTHPEYAFSKTADKTNFTMVHGKPIFNLFGENVRNAPQWCLIVQ